MTIFRYQAGLFPIHMGRPWLAYWVFQFQTIFFWVNFNSPYFGMYLQFLRIYLYHLFLVDIVT
jgi:hypothetical protein